MYKQKGSMMPNDVAETVQFLLAQSGVFINDQIPGLSNCSLGKKQLEFVRAVMDNSLEKVESIIKEEKYLCIDACDEVNVVSYCCQYDQ